MVMIQLDISDDLNKRVKLYSVNKDFNDKRLAMIDILEEKLGVTNG